jgi:hypothetical protein
MKELLFMFVVIVFFTFGLNIYMHESVHQLIYEDYGIKSHVVYINFTSWNAVTYAEGNVTTCDEMCIQAHEMNEIVTYNIEGFFVMVAMGFLIVICYLFKINRNLEKNEN